jgi:arsenate reductase
MAEGLLRALAGDRFEVHSAGLDPQPVAELAVRVMHELGVDISGQRPKSVLDFLGRLHIGTLITVCDRAEALCPVFPGNGIRLHWPTPDPAEARGSEEERLEAFRATRDELLFKISSWLMDQGVAGPFETRPLKAAREETVNDSKERHHG